ncbi:ERC protein 2 isoform X10 [Neoarius graeffei]|uniref:ERC protein 2 isoform X10 n=1 Tax=Neoarius graeffei TaxID=443677 RepID=UPI00298CB171|nr:ERC protein 2 isoform X10 [Neoarius graeffei]
MYSSAQSVGHAEASPLQSPHLHSSPRMGHRRVNAGRRGSECGGGRKTLSMENIQSLNAAYTASGPVYVSDHEALSSTDYPKGTMTLGRTTSRGKAAIMGSSPNISSSLGHLHLDSGSYGDHGTMHLLPQHQWPFSPLLRQAVRGVARREGNPLIEHLRELQMDSNMFQRELDVRDSTLGSSVNSIKNFWSPELKKKRGKRKESVAKTSKEQMSVMKEKNQSTSHPFCFDPDVIWQDTKISSLERNIRELEDEIQMLKTNGLLNMDNRDERLKQIDVYKNHSKFMKSKDRFNSPVSLATHQVTTCSLNQTYLLPQQQRISDRMKIDQLKQDLSKKESEMLALQTQLETLTNQNSDCKQHIKVLKESLTAKEQRANIMQTEVDALRLRLEEKESFLNKKSKQLQDVADEKGTLNGEIGDLKDMLEVKERKIIVLQKKIENLQDQLKDKDKQLGCLRDRVKSLQTDSSNTDTALATLEEALSEKERVIEQLKEKREKEEWTKQGEMEVCKKENKELKDKIASLQTQLLEKESLLQGRSLALEREESSHMNPEISERLKVLEKEVTFHKEESGKSRAEVDRLLGVLRELEAKHTEKDKAISELERQVKERSNKSLSSPNTPQMGETRPPDAAPEAHITRDSAQETAEKIKELEKALRESMNTSTHREALWVQEEQAHALAQRQLEDLMAALEKTRQELDVTKQQLSSTQNSLAERENHLSSMRQERRKQLEEILEMKQQALLAAISEKDANIALLELSAPKKKTSQEEVMTLKREKDRLMYQLKQQTQSRMKLIAENYEDGHFYPRHPHHPHHSHPGHTHYRRPSRGLSTHSNPQPQQHEQPEQDDEEGIWA